MCQFIHLFRHQFRLSLSLIYNFLHFDSPLGLLIHLVSVEYVSKDGKKPSPNILSRQQSGEKTPLVGRLFFFSDERTCFSLT